MRVAHRETALRELAEGVCAPAAIAACPSAYGASGVMTFMVNQDGVVWQRDLGADTAQAAAAIEQFNPDNGWTPLVPEG